MGKTTSAGTTDRTLDAVVVDEAPDATVEASAEVSEPKARTAPARRPVDRTRTRKAT
jgi:hypothetical protein